MMANSRHFQFKNGYFFLTQTAQFGKFDQEFSINYRGLSKGGAGGAVAPPYFVRIEDSAGQRRRAALLLAPLVLESY